MKLEGIHHVTAITGDAPGNVDFYARVLGLRLVKKTVNQDDPTVYHLFYADERGSAGADMTFFEYPGARRGRAGAGMVHTVVWRVASEDALDFWERRLADESVATSRKPGRLRFSDPEGIGIELAVVETDDEPLVAESPEIPREHALQGFDGVRAYAADPERERAAAAGRARLRGAAARARARSAATGAAASTPTTRPRPTAASAAPAPSTTSPSPRRWRSTTPGASGPASTASRRRP